MGSAGGTYMCALLRRASSTCGWGLGWVGLAASCRSRPSGVGVLPCPTTRLNYLTVRVQGRAGYRQPPDLWMGGWGCRVVVVVRGWGGGGVQKHCGGWAATWATQQPGEIVLLLRESCAVVPPRTRAAAAPRRPSHVGAGDAAHKVLLRVWRVLTTADVGNGSSTLGGRSIRAHGVVVCSNPSAQGCEGGGGGGKRRAEHHIPPDVRCCAGQRPPPPSPVTLVGGAWHVLCAAPCPLCDLLL